MDAATNLEMSEDCLRDFRPEATFGYRLWHVSHAYQRCAEAALAPLGLTQMQFVLLASAAWTERAWGVAPTQTELARQARVDRMMVSKVLTLLETKAYVARQACPGDERAKRVVLTPLGRRTLRQAIPAMLEAQRGFFGRLSADGQAALTRELDALLRIEGIAPPAG